MRGSYILHIPLIRPQNASKCQVPRYPKRFEAGLVELVGSCYNWPVHIAQYQQFKVKRNQPQRPRLLGLQTQAKHGLAADTLPIRPYHNHPQSSCCPSLKSSCVERRLLNDTASRWHMPTPVRFSKWRGSEERNSWRRQTSHPQAAELWSLWEMAGDASEHPSGALW